MVKVAQTQLNIYIKPGYILSCSPSQLIITSLIINLFTIQNHPL